MNVPFCVDEKAIQRVRMSFHSPVQSVRVSRQLRTLALTKMGYGAKSMCVSFFLDHIFDKDVAVHTEKYCDKCPSVRTINSVSSIFLYTTLYNSRF